MKNILLLLVFCVGCTQSEIVPTTSPAKISKKDLNGRIGKYFADVNGCFILYDVKSLRTLVRFNPQQCAERFSPCSTFKIPLALMAYDKGVINDETQFKWDNVERERPELNQEQNPESWIKNSVVWVSQQITAQLGMPTIGSYLKDFAYGNGNFSGGLESAWLTRSPVFKNAKPTLKISADEQRIFLTRMWQSKLKISPAALSSVKKITFIEESPNGFKLHGKTGSGFVGAKNNLRLGWFVSHLANDEQEYVAITNFIDKSEKPNADYGGFDAKKISKEIFAELGKW